MLLALPVEKVEGFLGAEADLDWTPGGLVEPLLHVDLVRLLPVVVLLPNDDRTKEVFLNNCSSSSILVFASYYVPGLFHFSSSGVHEFDDAVRGARDHEGDGAEQDAAVNVSDLASLEKNKDSEKISNIFLRYPCVSD